MAKKQFKDMKVKYNLKLFSTTKTVVAPKSHFSIIIKYQPFLLLNVQKKNLFFCWPDIIFILLL